MTRLLLSIFAAATLVTGLACAQGMGPGQGMGQGPGMTDVQIGPAGAPVPAARLARRLAMLTKVLDLTDAQVEAAKKVFTDEAAQVKAARAILDGVPVQMQAAVKTNNLGEIDRLSVSIGTVHGQVVAIQAKARAAFRLILTPDQIAKFDALKAHLREN